MDPRLLRYYNQELAHVREMGAEFAAQFPKIAARLAIDGIEVADPYVERLMEGFAFLAGRVQLKLDAEFPRFTQRMLEVLYPQYLAPTPSMLIAQLRPDVNDANLARGHLVPRASSMRNPLGKGDRTACEWRTAHDVRLYPVELHAASYFSFAPDLPIAQLPVAAKVKSGVRLHLKAGGGLGFDQLAMDTLPLHFCGNDEVAYKLHELVLGRCVGVLVVPLARPHAWHHFIAATQVRALGYADDEALLPVTRRGLQAYRLLHEYHAFAQRFLFAEVGGIGAALKRCRASEVEIVLLFGRAEPSLENVASAENFALHCTPAINLLSKRADRIHLGDAEYEHHVVVDRTRPIDFEVVDVETVTGYGSGADARREFRPFYGAPADDAAAEGCYFTLLREPRLLSAEQRRSGSRSSYAGSEVFLSLVDANEAPYGGDLKELSIGVLCTNRDLPLSMPVGSGATDLVLDSAAPVASIRVRKGPTKPASSLREGSVAWRFIDHLSLNYLSLVEGNERDGAAALRDMMELYAVAGDAGTARQAEGLRAVRVRKAVRRFPLPGPIAFGRGLEIELDVDELAFQGGSAFLFGALMEQFFARYVSINSFTETVLRGTNRGEIMRWVPRCGDRPIL